MCLHGRTASRHLASNSVHTFLQMVQVRYESRKRLAEARPRVRGQFVRQDSARKDELAAPVASAIAALVPAIAPVAGVALPVSAVAAPVRACCVRCECGCLHKP